MKLAAKSETETYNWFLMPCQMWWLHQIKQNLRQPWPAMVSETCSKVWQPHIFGLQWSHNLAVNSDSHTSLVYRGHRNWQWTLTATHLWSTEVTESGSELWQPHIFGLQRSQKLAVNSDSHTSSAYRGHRNWQWTLMATYLQSTEVTETCSKIWQPHVCVCYITPFWWWILHIMVITHSYLERHLGAAVCFLLIYQFCLFFLLCLLSLFVCLSVCLSFFLTGHRTCSKFFGLESQKLELNNILVQVHRDQEILINLSFFTSLFSAVKFHSCPSKDQNTQK